MSTTDVKPTRDSLRSIALGAQVQKERKSLNWEGKAFEVIQPTIRERSEIRKASMNFTFGAKKGDGATGEFDMFTFLILGAVRLTVVPGTEDRVFEDADMEALGKGVCGGLIDQLAELAAEFLNLDPKETKNDSGGTE